jgi:hypothetical protein
MAAQQDKMAVTLPDMPPEILLAIFQWLRPEDVVALPRVCSAFRDLVQTNRRTICHGLYLNIMDTPADMSLDWEREVRDMVVLGVISRQKHGLKRAFQLPFVCEAVPRLLKNASASSEPVHSSSTHVLSRNAKFVKKVFEGLDMRRTFMQRSVIFERTRDQRSAPAPRLFRPPVEPTTHFPPKVEHQQSAKLHCLYGRPITQLGHQKLDQVYPFARSKVYDLRQYTRLTRWGPFMDDVTGRVDWEKVEAVMVVLGHNMSLHQPTYGCLPCPLWELPFSGSWPNSYKASPGATLSELDARDPYGVTGCWCRVVCHMDYNDFFTYNFGFGLGFNANTTAPRQALNTNEATRLMQMQFEVTAVEPPGDEDGQELPVVHFEGTSHPLDEIQERHFKLRGKH